MEEIVVVDDDALIRELLAEWLGEAGYRVRQARTGSEALQMLRGQSAGLLITDMDMPGRDGAQTLEEARRLQPGLAVIAISGGARKGKRDWVATARELGASSTLAKPFERADLLAEVAKILPQQNSATAQP